MLQYRAVVFIFLIHCVPGEVVERCPRFLFVYTFTAMYTFMAIHVPKNLISGTFTTAVLAISSPSAHYRLTTARRAGCLMGVSNGLSNGVSNGVSNL